MDTPETRAAAAPSVVGIGGSAGALSAFQQLVELLPMDSERAFVVVSHGDPNRPSLLREILGRCTRLRVLDADDGMTVEPNTVYVAPPGRELTIEDRALRLATPADRRHPPLPIDVCFRSLAEVFQERAVGIVLSGTGMDGTLGLGAIRAEGGLTLVQDPETAEFRDMPSSAIAHGAVDFALPVAEMPEKLAAFVPDRARPEHTQRDTQQDTETERDGETEPRDLDPILSVVAQQTGRDFSPYKRGTLWRRIERRMHLQQIEDPERYARYVEEHPAEADALWRDWLIGVSGFFRDADAFEALEQALRGQIEQKSTGEELRVWVCGCASGEEAYSVAILLSGLIEELHRRLELRIFATDLDENAIDRARAGRYPEGTVADVGSERMRRFFHKEDDHYRVRKEIRDTIVFAPQNVLQDPPFTKMDLITCRNLLIYLAPEAQKRTLLLLHYSLKPGGILMLGASESVVGLEEFFEPLDSRRKIFRRAASEARARIPTDWTGASPLRPIDTRGLGETRPAKHLDFSELLRQQLVQHYAPPSVIVDAQGRIEQIHGRTGAFLEPAPGQPVLNVLEMAREGLRAPIASALHEIVRTDADSVEQDVHVRSDGDLRALHLVARRISDRRLEQPAILISFEAPRPAPRAVAATSEASGATEPEAGSKSFGDPSRRIAQLEEELRLMQQDRQGAIEELQATNEELASANEEIQSVNEELQSTNEELMTSKEETQSLNEELQTVNAELNAKVTGLEETQDDLLNLMNVTRIAIIFLDEQLRVKRFTPEAKKLFRLIDSDVGRALADLTTSLEYPDLESDAALVLRTLVPEHREVQNKDETWWTAEIRPYRTSRNAIAGVVLTFVNVTRLKDTARRAEAESRSFEAIVDTVREPLLVLDSELRVIRANRSFYETFQMETEGTKGSLLYELGSGQWDIPELRRLLENVLPTDERFEGFRVEHTFEDLGARTMLLNARRLQLEGQPGRILLAIEDVTDRPRSNRHSRRQSTPQSTAKSQSSEGDR